MKKGSKIYVEGSLQTRKYTDPNGVDKYTTEIVLSAFKGELIMLDPRGENNGSNMSGGFASSDNSNASSGWDVTPLSNGTESFDDEIPF